MDGLNASPGRADGAVPIHYSPPGGRVESREPREPEVILGRILDWPFGGIGHRLDGECQLNGHLLHGYDTRAQATGYTATAGHGSRPCKADIALSQLRGAVLRFIASFFSRGEVTHVS